MGLECRWNHVSLCVICLNERWCSVFSGLLVTQGLLPTANRSRSASDHPGQSFGQAASRVQLASPEWCGEWCIGLKDFNENTVGAKSRSVAALRGMLPDWINLPPSVTIPFGSFEEALKMEENKAKNAELQNAVKVRRFLFPLFLQILTAISPLMISNANSQGFEDNTKKALQTSRKIVTELQVPPRMKVGLRPLRVTL